LDNPVLHIVHCIDTEGPLSEDLSATFQRVGELFDIWLKPSRTTLAQLQNKEIPLDGAEEQVAAVLSPQLLNYNRTWHDVQTMLDEALSPSFRNKMVDDFGRGWVYSWHCVDHLGFSENPRHKDIGYGNVFNFYKDMLAETDSIQDEINWHFHPLSIDRKPLSAATSYNNNMDVLLYIIARRIIDNKWFPTTSRPGFHSERPDAHAFMEQWIPFDYANQSIREDKKLQRDTMLGRFGDWRRAPESWLGYHPHHDDYQEEGSCRRWVFRCLNVGTRFRLLTTEHIAEAFQEARDNGSAIVSFADHDYRDLRLDVEYVRSLIASKRDEFPDVKIRFSGAEEAAQAHVKNYEPELCMPAPKFSIELIEERVHVRLVSGSLFGPQPFLAIKTRDGRYYHDNLDIVEKGEHWVYVLDNQTLPPSAVETVGVGGAGRSGGFGVELLTL
jgi:hypothetical protein